MHNTVDGVAYAAWDGQVTFFVHPYVSMMCILQAERIKADVPQDKMSSIELMLFDEFRNYMAQTQSIQFDLKENAPPQLRRLKDLYELICHVPTAWDNVWVAYLETMTNEMREAWDAAVNSVVVLELAAAPELATPLPEGEALDNLPEDSPLSGRGTPSKRKSSKLSRPGNNPANRSPH